MATPEIYTFHSGMPGAFQLTAAGGAGQLDALLYGCGVTGWGSVTLDSLTVSGTVATATRAAGLSLADGIAGMTHIINISGATPSGLNGDWELSAAPGSTSCTFNVPAGLDGTATGTITLKRAGAGMTRLASASNKSVYQFRDTGIMPGYLMVDDSNAQYAGVRLAETAASPVDYSTMVGPCPTVAQQAAPGGIVRKTDGAGSANRSWVIVIDRGGVHLFIAAWNSYPTIHEGSYFGACHSLKLGDIYPGLVMASTSTNASVPNSSNTGYGRKNMTSQNGIWLQKSYNGAGSAIAAIKVGLWVNNSTHIGDATGVAMADPNPVNNANHINGPIYLFEGAALANHRGYVPGMYDPINAQSKSHLDIISGLANLPGRKILLVKGCLTTSTSSMAFFGTDITGPWRS